jgi:hypothetical protein
MSDLNTDIPVETLHLFPELDRLLIELLQSLREEEWHLPTLARLWTVKDIAAHLLDGNLRTLSMSRDNFFGEKPENINSYTDLVAYLNRLNHDWTNAARRLSTQVLINLLESTGKEYYEHLSTLNPFDKAIFSVAWAGEDTSYNWFHIAREYTEKFHHQMQIREVVSKQQALFTKELFCPFIDTLMFGLPHTYRNIMADAGTTIQLSITSEIGGNWYLMKGKDLWHLIKDEIPAPDATLTIDPNDAWKLFTKGMSPEDAIHKVTLVGDKELGQIALQMVSVMA